MIRTLALHLSPGLALDPSALILTHSLGYPDPRQALDALVSAVGSLVRAPPEPDRVCCTRTREALSEARYCAGCAAPLTNGAAVPVSRYAVLDYLRALASERGERPERRAALVAAGWTPGGMWLPDIAVITGVEQLAASPPDQHPPFRAHLLHIQGSALVTLTPGADSPP